MDTITQNIIYMTMMTSEIFTVGKRAPDGNQRFAVVYLCMLHRSYCWTNLKECSI